MPSRLLWAALDLRQRPNYILPQTPDDLLIELSPLVCVEQLPEMVRLLLIVRAGNDMPEIKESVDRFVHTASQQNLAIELISYPEEHHGLTSTTTRHDPAKSSSAQSGLCRTGSINNHPQVPLIEQIHFHNKM